jgi:hypothetical protein
MRIETTIALVLALAIRSAGAAEELDLETTTVTGNQELPRVMVIVPWKKSDPGEPRGKPLGSLLDEVLTPVDRAAFRRRLALHEDLRAEVDMQGQESTEE